jgi:alpha-galactosidase
MSDTTDRYLVLQGTKSTIILETASDRAPIWRYWGSRLPTGTLPPTVLDDERAVPTFSLDKNVPPTLFPTFGVGWFGGPALLAHRQSKSFAQDFSRVEILWTRANEAIVVSLFDDVAKIKVDISLDLSPATDVLTCQTNLTNLGDTSLEISWLAAACLPIPGQAHRVRYYTGRHNHEFVLCEDTLSRATWLRENRRGLTSHDCVPAAVVTCEGSTDHTGPAYGAQLAWSGNHVQRLDFNDDGSYQWQWGEYLAPGELVVAAGKSIETPAVLATFSPSGLNGIAQNFHAAIRSRMVWPGGSMKPRPVHLNTWEGVYFGLEQNALMEMARGAADLGIERFVLDDGWFHARRDDRAGLGDWWVDLDVFPDGLLPLAQHVTDLGMEFGLWVEPEMVNPDSDLFRAHPDWALQIEGRPRLTARNQLVLDLANPDVFDYLLGRLGKLLNELPISYLKWDHNRDLTTAAHGGSPAYRAQVQAAYRLFDAIRTSWPDVEIEACSGGGGRIDAGIIRHTHRFWTSDCIDAVSRVSIQRGFLQFFPPEVMGSHIGTSPAHTTGRQQAMDFRASVALGGHLGIELDPRSLSPSHKDKVRAWVQTYKQLRSTLLGGKVWQGQSDDSIVWQAQGHAHECVVSVFRTTPSALRFPPTLKLPFLDQGATYQVESVGPDNAVKPSDSALFQALKTAPVTISGAWLVQNGLALPHMNAEAAIILKIRILLA